MVSLAGASRFLPPPDDGDMSSHRRVRLSIRSIASAPVRRWYAFAPALAFAGALALWAHQLVTQRALPQSLPAIAAITAFAVVVGGIVSVACEWPNRLLVSADDFERTLGWAVVGERIDRDGHRRSDADAIAAFIDNNAERYEIRSFAVLGWEGVDVDWVSRAGRQLAGENRTVIFVDASGDLQLGDLAAQESHTSEGLVRTAARMFPRGEPDEDLIAEAREILAEQLVATRVDGIRWLPRGAGTDSVSPVAADRIVRELKRLAEIVLVVLPSYPRASVDASIAAAGDAVLLALPTNRVRELEVWTLEARLRSLGANVAGIVLDHSREARPRVSARRTEAREAAVHGAFHA